MINKTELQTILQSKYSRSSWQKLFRDILPNISLFSIPQEILITEIGLEGRIEKLYQLGTARLQDGRNINIFELKLTEKVKLYKNKVEMRNLISKYIEIGENNGVLAIFDSADEDYRLTFSAKDAYLSATEGIVEQETDSKRYTYLLGPNESCRTAAERLFELYESKSELTLEQLTKAFSVEKLNKQFFADYTGIYDKFTEYLGVSYDKKIKENDKAITGEFAELFKDKVDAREFVKKLMGRVVFIHFVQKKGWMGCPLTTEKWEKGNKEFLWDFWKNCPDKEHFYSDYLIKLFFEGFNTKREGDIFEHSSYRIPYLNGGLFSDDRPGTNRLNFPIEIFEDFLNKLNQYNFTIDENDPFEVEVGIDPEMLGHIFENLLEENKEKGAFYTPKIIVEYMCKESLIAYLQTGLVEKKIIKGNDEKAREEVELFIREHGSYIENGIIQSNLKVLDNLLKEVKVCDPAVGSGAFPMGMLKEITWARMALENSADIYKIKKETIANSLYGVDIDPGAIDIARLRYWLALVVDAEEPEPLPNLDYKLMQGNSLLESFEGIDLSKVMEDKNYMVKTVVKKDQELLSFYDDEPVQQQILFSDDRKKKIIELKNEYFSTCEIQRKNEIHAMIDKIVLDHIESCLEVYKDNLQLKIENIEKELESLSLNKSDAVFDYLWNKSSKGKQHIAWRQEQDITEEKYKKLEDLQNSSDRPFFLWHLYFSEVFENQPGFDIVIGNPPYIQLQRAYDEEKQFADIYKSENYRTFERTGDIYCLFYEQGYNLLSEKGHLCYITSNKWMRANYGKSLRKFLAKETNPKRIIDFSGFKVFDAATVDTNILIYQKQQTVTFQTTACTMQDYYKKGNSIADFLKTYGVIIEDFSEESWIIAPSEEMKIKQKIENIGTPLKEWDVSIYRGILTGLNEAFIISGAKKDELITADPKSAEIIKPVLRGRDIKRYQAEFADLWLIATHNGYIDKDGKKVHRIDVDEYPAIKKHLDQYWEQIEKRCDQGDTPYNLRHCAYYEEFEREKVVYNDINQELTFCIVEKGCFFNNTVYFITDSIYNKVFLGILNAKLLDWYYRKVSAQLGKKAVRMFSIYVSKIPIPKLSIELQKDFNDLVETILHNKTVREETQNQEDKIDLMVYKLYNLSYQEAKIVDPELDDVLSQFSLSKDDYENMSIEELSRLET